ncbi:MAG: capsular biosynthesis protein [Firmicutes bacterium]|nr:capsular biosynthesis protein [Bacillota bacterium]MCM1401959.1 capsular biosynthesis protein [Bacteroides sp.]MCM1477899.1 capsular biosynthesis protein [Bacteroides sp.]
MGFLSKIKSMLGGGSSEYILSGHTDWHSHLLPGVDDGVQTLDESLSILDAFEKRGVTELWLTPHIMEDMPNTTQDLRHRFSELTEAYKGNIKLHLASENMLDTIFTERFDRRDFLPIGPNADMLLVETSFYNPPTGLEELLFSLHSVGLTPLLAHPERYRYMDMEQYRVLHKQGVKFQLNLMSLIGHYGPEAKAKAKLLAKEGLYSHVGSDIHHSLHIPLLDKVRSDMAHSLSSIIK